MIPMQAHGGFAGGGGADGAGGELAARKRPQASLDAPFGLQGAPLPCVAYLYDGTAEGLFSAIFDAYVFHEDPEDFFCDGSYQPRLGQSSRVIATDEEKALRVRRGLVRVGGSKVFRAALHASLSDEPQAGAAVYRFVRYVMDDLGKRPSSARPSVMGQLAHPCVAPVASLERQVLNEAHRMKQFLRFRQKEGGLWVAVCNPNANVIPLVMDHFSGRFNTQPFAIYDEVHHVAGISQDGRWRLARVSAEAELADCTAEELTAQAWCVYYDSASIDVRYHPELRRQFMPMRLWGNITEMSRPRAHAIGEAALSGLPNAAALIDG